MLIGNPSVLANRSVSASGTLKAFSVGGITGMRGQKHSQSRWRRVRSTFQVANSVLRLMASVTGDAGETVVRPPRAGERFPRVLLVVGDAVVEFDKPSVERAEGVFQVFVLGVVDHAPDATKFQQGWRFLQFPHAPRSNSLRVGWTAYFRRNPSPVRYYNGTTFSVLSASLFSGDRSLTCFSELR